MKRNTIFFRFPDLGALLLAIVFLSSCVKSRPGETDFGALKPTVLIPEGGISTFSSQALLFPGTDLTDTATFHVNFAATNVAPADETVTLAIDPGALANYNGSSSIQYSIAPDSIFSFTTTSATVKKGNSYSDPVPLTVYPSKVDPTKNYMIPISIKTAPAGATISGNYGTIYYHLIGNPIAGAYSQHWIRYNGADTVTGTKVADKDEGTVLFSPVDNTTVSVVSNGTGETDVISFANNAGVLSNFSVSIPPVAGITVGPGVVESADPVLGIYRIYFTYVNGSGAPRCIINIYTKQ